MCIEMYTFSFNPVSVNGIYSFLYRDQMKALKRGLELLAVGGMLMYTTSSYNPVENEAVVLHVLKECEGRCFVHPMG